MLRIRCVSKVKCLDYAVAQSCLGLVSFGYTHPVHDDETGSCVFLGFELNVLRRCDSMSRVK